MEHYKDILLLMV